MRKEWTSSNPPPLEEDILAAWQDSGTENKPQERPRNVKPVAADEAGWQMEVWGPTLQKRFDKALKRLDTEALRAILPKVDPDYLGGTLVNLVEDQNEKALTCLLDAGANANLTDSVGFTPILLAVREQQYNTVQLLIRWGADLRLRDSDGKDSLMYAVEVGNLPILQDLTRALGDLDEAYLCKLMRLARDCNQRAIGKFLSTLRHTRQDKSPVASNLNRQSCGEITTNHPKNEPTNFTMAVATQSSNQTQSNTTQGRNRSGPPLEELPRYLLTAAEAGVNKIVRTCISRGVHVDTIDANNGETALHKAARSGHVEIVQMLLAANADLMRRDKHNHTPFDAARAARQIETARLLRAAMIQAQQDDTGAQS